MNIGSTLVPSGSIARVVAWKGSGVRKVSAGTLEYRRILPSGGEGKSCGRQMPMSWRCLPGLNRMVRPGGIRTSLPVRGFRPIPRLRGFTWKTPKPRSSIRSPFCIERLIAWNTASTATSALTLVMAAAFETSLTISTLTIGSTLSMMCNYHKYRDLHCQVTA